MHFENLIRWLLLLPVFCQVGALAADLPSAPAEIRVMSYNVFNFMALKQPQIKSLESRQTVINIIDSVNPDIMLLVEIGDEAAVEEIRQALAQKGKTYPFASTVNGYDHERHLAVLAKIKPVSVNHDVTSAYNLKGRRIRVRRGFAHCTFEWRNGYRLHLLGAHLKSKCFHALGQTDMRRYEARQLRYLFNDLLKQEPEANILVMGDMNDTPDASPISELCGRRYKTTRQLYDLRPVDKHTMSWTHLWDVADSYTRIDYAMASYFLLPEIDFKKNTIPLFPEWNLASDHRPIVVTLRPDNRKMKSDLLAGFERNFRKAPVPLASFHEGRIIGTRKARR